MTFECLESALIIISTRERKTTDLVCCVPLEGYVVGFCLFVWGFSHLPKQHKKTETSKEGRNF